MQEFVLSREEKNQALETKAADLLTARVVVRRLQPATGMHPYSRLAGSQNLSPRHLLLFMRWLLGKKAPPMNPGELGWDQIENEHEDEIGGMGGRFGLTLASFPRIRGCARLGNRPVEVRKEYFLGWTDFVLPPGSESKAKKV